MLPNFTPVITPSALVHVRREYIRHNQKHVAFLAQYYHLYTIAELSVLLAVPPLKLKELARRAGIRKRAANKQPHPKKRKPLITVSGPLAG